MRQTIKIGITFVVVAALAMSGIALAATTDDDTVPAVEDSRAYQGIQSRLAPLVEAGTITQAQADAVTEALATGRGPGGMARGFRVIHQVADFLGLTVEEMRAAIQEYDTLADIAAANGSSADELVAHLVAAFEEHLALAVENGRITQERADELLAGAVEHLTEIVNGEIPQPPADRPGSRGRGGGMGGPRHDA